MGGRLVFNEFSGNFNDFNDDQWLYNEKQSAAYVKFDCPLFSKVHSGPPCIFFFTSLQIQLFLTLLFFVPSAPLTFVMESYFIKNSSKCFAKYFIVWVVIGGQFRTGMLEEGSVLANIFFVKLRKKNMKSLCYFYD